ncbi:type cbb3 cytochrome oxidase biogenesis protein CcoI [Psychrobacter sp. JCM 18902]|nr:type cbb3 cytochrome oxidase biogenesis protein CcoI [Psychrobacter sp. JCM 18902]
MSNVSSSMASTTSQHYEDNSIIEGLVLPLAGHCFHCGDPVPQPPFHAKILGKPREMCCMGCQLASQSIVEAGLEQYYLDRSEINRTASLPTQLTRLRRMTMTRSNHNSSMLKTDCRLQSCPSITYAARHVLG